MGNHVIIQLLLVCFALFLLTGCTQSLETTDDEESIDTQIMRPHLSPEDDARVPPDYGKQHSSLPPNKHATVDECITDWETALRDSPLQYSLKSSRINVIFVENTTLVEATQILEAAGLSSSIYDPLALFFAPLLEQQSKGEIEERTPEEIFATFRMLQTVAKQGEEITLLCTLAQDETIHGVQPDLKMGLFTG